MTTSYEDSLLAEATAISDDVARRIESMKDHPTQVMLDQLDTLISQVAKLTTEIQGMREEMAQAKGALGKIQAEVGPVLETLQNNSMFKMMFGGKGK